MIALTLAACDGGGSPPIRISEVMYHPVLEDDYVEHHEFVELVNTGDGAVDLGGWRMTATNVLFDIPAGTMIGPGEYRVIARDRAALAALYGLDPAIVIGDYADQLVNGRDTIMLFDDGGGVVDELGYDDDAPWPVGADALGASEKWLDPAVLPLAAHQYEGISLERIDVDLPAADPASWAPSPLDGATPGAPNASAAAEPPAIVLDRDHATVGTDEQIAVTLSAAGPVAAVELEWFVDDIAIDAEPTTVTPMTDAGARTFTAAIPAVAPGVVVRYRVLVDRGAGAGFEIISPRPSDPYRWHAFAATPPVATATRTYHLAISPRSWGQMWTNIAAGRDSGCSINPTWDDEVPAVLLVDDKVYDVRVRYQGSRYNRTNGIGLSAWPYPGPDTGPILALSWHIAFPRYKKLGGKGAITLNKNSQGCPGIDAGVGFALFRAAGVPAPETNYAQLYINGGYYHYMVEIERPGDEMMARWSELVGDLYKSVGGAEDVAYGWGDERALGDNCGLVALDRYGLTYDRKTWSSWGTPDAIATLIGDLATARAQGPAAERAFFADNFDLDRLLDYYAIMNWGVPFDDMFQNHFLYRRRDGKWLLMPWDLDLDFGGWNGANASLYVGEEGDPDNRSGWWNYLKDAFFDAYRPEFDQHLRQMVEGPLAPEAIAPMVDAWVATGNLAEAQAAPAGFACGSFDPRAASWKQFAIDRQAVIRQRIP